MPFIWHSNIVFLEYNYKNGDRLNVKFAGRQYFIL